MVNDRVPDVPPPGAGLVTVTVTDCRRGDIGGSDGRSQLRCTNECSGLGRTVEFHNRCGHEASLPLTVSVKAAPPAVALVGESEVSVGAGLLMVKV